MNYRIIDRFGNFIKTVKQLSLTGAYSYYKLKYLRNSRFTIEKIKLGNKYKVSVGKNAGDLCTLYEVFVQEDYKFDARNTELALRILDIGANIGYFSLYISGRYPKAKVFAFEPFPDSFKRLEENVRSNDIKNISILPYAVSDSDGEAELYATEWAGCNTLLKGKFQEGCYSTVKVNSISLERIFEYIGEGDIDFAKIDCEGSEYPIILKSRSEILIKIKEYVIEVHTDSNYDVTDLIRRFEELGFSTNIQGNILRAKLL